MLFYEASAKTAESVNVAFISLARKLMSKRDTLSSKQPLAIKKKAGGPLGSSTTSNSTTLSNNRLTSPVNKGCC